MTARIVSSPTTRRGTAVDVLVVGAGPSGLTLASQLARFGVRFRIVDKAADRAGESRALAVQARSLEVLQTIGLGEKLTHLGRTATRVLLHVDRGAPPSIDLGSLGRDDTRFPFVLFISQRDTEAVLAEFLDGRGVAVERGVQLETMAQSRDGVDCLLRHSDGGTETIRARYVAGCDGAHSTVRKQAGIPFEGGAYPQEFALGDVEADGLERGVIHAFVVGRGMAMFFPLGRPRTWRVMAMDALRSQTDSRAEFPVTINNLSLEELQSMIADPTYGSVKIYDAAWLTRFRLHHRQAARYREDRAFLVGDAAHIHSPVGAQGMNTGIQDAWNLGWKLAMAVKGQANGQLLDSYHAERWPVGRTLLRATDRLFATFARSIAGSPTVASLRRIIVRRVVAPALARPRVRAAAFHFVSQLGIRYRRSPAVTEGEPTLGDGPRAGDRLPDARVVRDGKELYLHECLSSPHVHLLLCGRHRAFDENHVAALSKQFEDVLSVQHLSGDAAGGVITDPTGKLLARLGVHQEAMYLIRPDGHVAFRCGGSDLLRPAGYLARWFTRRDLPGSSRDFSSSQPDASEKR